jgi:hypothetical protein
MATPHSAYATASEQSGGEPSSALSLIFIHPATTCNGGYYYRYNNY